MYQLLYLSYFIFNFDQICCRLHGIYTLLLQYIDLMGWITYSGCARKDWITPDKVEYDLVIPGAAIICDPPNIRSSY